jgi:aerobic carbon-monoxide dehydrogenase medium subunit
LAVAELVKVQTCCGQNAAVSLPRDVWGSAIERDRARGRGVKAPAFAYACPTELAAALDLLTRYGEDAQILAGGQSLMPSLNFRLAAPAVLVDINRIAMLRGIERRGADIRIGALVRHAEVESSAIIRADLPLIAEAIAHVAHPAIRSRGTFGGSLANADPAAELPACAVGLGARLVLESAAGRRTVAAEDFYRGLFQTDRRTGEILVEALIPRQQEGQRSAFLELSRRHGDFAVAGIACQAEIAVTSVRALRLVVFGSESHPRLARHAAAAAIAEASHDLGEKVAEALADDLDPIADLHGDRAMKLHLAQVLARRAMARLIAA